MTMTSADEIAEWILEYFMGQIKRHKTYRNSNSDNFIINDHIKCRLRKKYREYT